LSSRNLVFEENQGKSERKEERQKEGESQKYRNQ